MNKKIDILEIDDKKKLILWDDDEKASLYEVVGMDNLFILTPIKKVKENRLVISNKDLDKYIKICVRYLYNDKKVGKDFVLYTTDLFDIKHNYDAIEIKAIQSFKGITFSFYSEEIYDKYYVYERKDDGDVLIVETEDFQANSEEFIEGNKYYVEAFKKKDDSFEFVAKSDIFICSLEMIKKPEALDLTIVVPVYNGELYLARGIDSILLSNFHNYEIIIVDDGSTDNSKKIINWYTKNYKGIIRTIYQENKGPSFARNTGINEANGEYTALLDCDDMVHPYMYKQLVEFGKENNLPIVIAKTLIRKNINDNYYYLNPTKQPDKDNIIYSFEEMFREKDKNSYDNIYFVAVWNKIIKTTLTKAHLFPELNRYEDNAYTMMIYSYVNKFGFCKKAYHMWDQRWRKTMGTYSTSYHQMSSVFLNICYVTASFYCTKEGNPKRMVYLAYHAVKEVFKLLTDTKTNLLANSYAWSYIQEIKELNKKTDLLNNPYIQLKKELLSFVEKALNYKSV